MFFSDLTPYAYLTHHQTGNDLNVGWLSRDHAFPVGDTSNEFRRALCELATEPVNCCMGSHDCEFCAPPMTESLPWHRRPVQSNSVASGNGEIRVPALQGDIVYVAPQLVAHYVEVHNYLPPPPFVEAVEDCAHRRRLAWEGLRAQWKERFPALDGRWTHWRLFAYGWLISVASRDELAQAVERVERYYRANLAVGVSRSYGDPGGEGVIVEPIRHEISEGLGDLPQELADAFVAGMQARESSEL